MRMKRNALVVAWLLALLCWQADLAHSFVGTSRYDGNILHAKITLLHSTTQEKSLPDRVSPSNIQKTVENLAKSSAQYSVTPKIASILHQWSQDWLDQDPPLGLLSKKNLLHEVEESIVALQILLDWLDGRPGIDQQPIVIVDACCGKGVFSMLASYLFQDDSRISRVVMMDKDPNVDWSHVHVANQDAAGSNRPLIETRKCNLYDVDETIEWLSSSFEGPLALVGIHLCKNLSPTLVGISNALGPSKAPFMCLAPCCLPRVVLQGRYRKKQQLLEVAKYESPLQRQARLVAASRRKNARRRKTPCLLCQSTDHRIQHCPILPPSQQEQSVLFERAAALEPCWKCGELGHTKKDCPSTQKSSIPSTIARPVTHLDVSNIISDSNDPFETYCEQLCTTIERPSVQIVESHLKPSESSRREHQNNWNRNRKSLYIAATASS